MNSQKSENDRKRSGYFFGNLNGGSLREYNEAVLAYFKAKQTPDTVGSEELYAFIRNH